MDYSLYKRNQYLLSSKGFQEPKTISTGTTIEGVILAADTRATEGPIVADKNCEKIHYIAQNIYCCGAGTAADTEFTTKLASSKLELHRLNTGQHRKWVRVMTAMTKLKQYLFRYQGHVGAALILGGVDPIDGPQLYSIHPHGSVDKLPYCTMGSGSLAAMAVFESSYKPMMTMEEGIELTSRAILAGVFNDLGSGSNVDILVIGKNGFVDYKRNCIKPNQRPLVPKTFKIPLGTTTYFKEKREYLVKDETITNES